MLAHLHHERLVQPIFRQIVKPALIARMFGGLGNQLFVYANARAIAHRNGVPLLLDTKTGFYRDAYRRNWCLQHFDIQYNEAGVFQSFDFPGGRLVRKMIRSFNNNVARVNYLLEKNYEQFDAGIKDFEIRNTTWIEGYWQSPL